MAFNYSFRVAVSLAVALLAGVMWTVDVFWGALCTALLPIALYWQQKLYRHHVRKVLFMLDAIENNDNAIHFSETENTADALVDDAVRNFGHAVNIGFTGAVVAAFDRIVEQPVDRIVVVAVVLGRIDTALRRDRMRTARRVLDAENLHVVSQFAERSGCGGTAQARTYDDNIQFAFVGRAYYLDRRLVVAPLLREFPGGYFESNLKAISLYFYNST